MAIANTHPQKVKAVGFDSDPSMVAKAQQQFPHLDFFQADVRNFALDDNVAYEPFDALFSNAALHWVPVQDAERAVAAMSKTLKIGGRLVVEFGGKGNVQTIVQAAQGVILGTQSPWYFPSISEYSTLLESHGIEVTSAILYDRPTPLENGGEGMRNWIQCFGNAFFEGLSKEEQEEALERIDTYLRQTSLHDAENDCWIADYRRIRIMGKRTV